jgi:hypothetical protein
MCHGSHLVISFLQGKPFTQEANVIFVMVVPVTNLIFAMKATS